MMWTARGIYDGRDMLGSSFEERNPKRTEEKTFEQKHSTPAASVAVEKLLKPIRNRNLVTNPYRIDPKQYLINNRLRKLPALTRISESVLSVTSTNCESRQQEETQRLCTVRELLDAENFPFQRSS